MRILMFFGLLFLFVTVKAQSVSPPASRSMYPQKTIYLNKNFDKDSLPAPKWFLSSSAGLATGLSFSKYGNASALSAPMGLQLNRRISNNLYGFANVSVAPSYISFRPSYLNAGFDHRVDHNSFRQNNFGLYPAASIGLMYINDARTFSISGSVSAERSSYPLVPYFPMNNTKQNTDFLHKK